MPLSGLKQFRLWLESFPAEQKLPLIQEFLRGIDDPEKRALTEIFLIQGQLETRKQIVVLIHGILSHGVWQERLVHMFAEADIEAHAIGFGYLDILTFWSPVFTRKSSIKRVLRELRNLRAANPTADISVVAHSYGTYIISRILGEEMDIKIHRLQLCGSILPQDYRWDKALAGVTGTVVNDVGTDDIWPVMAKLASWGYGVSGTFGFKTIRVIDRFHPCSHNDFFKEEHVKAYWLPFLIYGQVVRSKWTQERPDPGLGITLLSWLPLKTIVGIIASIWLSYKVVSYF
ncbi:MAG: hypothetical protein V4443_12300 [Pseudomonadota bacterium]